MIDSLSIERFRGIVTGRLDGFTPLCILLGTNGSGKSTVLDALHIAASTQPGQSIGESVRRRDVLRGARWLFHAGDGSQSAELQVSGRSGSRRLSLSLQMLKKGAWSSQVFAREAALGGPPTVYTKFKSNNDFEPVELLPLEEDDFDTLNSVLEPIEVRFVDLRDGQHRNAILKAHTAAVEQGALGRIIPLLAEVIPGLKDFRLVTDDKNEPVVMLDFGSRAVPAALAGDGAYALIRLAFELASKSEPLVLIEEPEIHQHPAALRRTAQVLRTAVDRGTQVILSTHSLDLFDFLVSEASPAQLEKISVYRLNLRDGELASSRWQGREVYDGRDEAVRDLR